MVNAAPDERSAHWIGLRYSRLRELGGSANVWVGRDRLAPSSRQVVIKEMAGDGAAALQAEVDLLLRSGHPAFREVLATERVDESLVAVLEHIEGERLDEYLPQHLDQATRCSVDILRALVFLHGEGFVHGDLKPQNLIVSDEGVHVIDLGLSVPIGSPLSGVTPGFSPPEAMPGTAASVGADLYSFAAALRGCGVPIEGALGEVLQFCLAESPSQRPATADILLGILGRTVHPIDRTGDVPRAVGRGSVSLIEEALDSDSGRVIVVEGPPGAGRTRLIADGCRQALGAGQAVATVSLAGGHDPFLRLAEILLTYEPEPGRKALLGIASAANRGLPLIVDDAEQAVPAVREALVNGAAALRELGRGALVVVGADEELARSMERAGAQREHLERLGSKETTEVLRAAGALSGKRTLELVHEIGEGWPGRCVLLAQELAEKPEMAEDELRHVIVSAAESQLDLASPRSLEKALEEAAALFEGGATLRAARLLSGFDDKRALGLLARIEARLGNLERATQLIGRCKPIDDHSLRIEAAQWLERRGQYEAAWDLVEDALESGEKGKTLVLGARAALGIGELRKAEELARQGLSKPGLNASTECRLRCVLSDAARLLGDASAAAKEGERAAAAASNQDDPTLSPQSIARQAAAHALSGNQRRARELYLQALEEALSAGDVTGIPPYVLNLATAEHILGEYGSALHRYQEAARIARRLGRQVVETAALVNWAGLLVDLGAIDEGAPILEEGITSAAKADAAFYGALARLVGATLKGHRDPREGYDEALKASEDFLACGADQMALEALLLAGELAVASGEWEMARGHLNECASSLEESGLVGRAALLRARIAFGTSDLQEALRETDQCIEAATAAGDPDLEGRALTLAARTHKRLGTGAADPLVARAQETFGRVSAMLPSGLREKYLRAPDRRIDSLLKRETSEATLSASIRGEALRLWALVRRLLLEGSETRLLEAAVDEALSLTGAERAFLLLRRESKKAYVAVARNMAAVGASAGDRGARFSRSVAERALESGELIATTNASAESSLRKANSVHFLGLRSILCVPIRGPRGVAGALYLDHRLETARFGAEQSELVQALADIIGVALENARLNRKARENEKALARANDALRRENEKRGAEIERLGHLLDRCGEHVSLDAPGGIIGRSKLLHHAVEMARRTAPSELPILVEGASGTGKELIARYVHEQSGRAGPFVAVNCGALPATLLDSELFGHVKGAFTGADRHHPGLFRSAEAGTLMLDEIGEMPLEVQPRLLRVLQEREVWPLGRERPVSVNVRVVAATNKDLDVEVAEGRFRKDLYYRLAGVRIGIPPLQERREDVPLLAAVFLKRATEAVGRSGLGLSRAALKHLLQHDWPGNVRELEQTIQRAALLAEGAEIEPVDLGLEGRPTKGRKTPRSFNVDVVQRALDAESGNRKNAAKRLGVSRSTLYRWLERYDI